MPQLRRAFWLGAIGIFAVGLTFSLLGWLNQRSVHWAMQSQLRGQVALTARNRATDRRAAIEAYLVSAQRISLAPEFAARARLAQKLDSLLLLTRDEASQHDRAQTIRAAVDRWERGWATRMLATSGPGGIAANAADTLAGKELFDSILGAFASFLTSEQLLFERRLRLLNALERFTFAAVVVEIALLMGVLFWLSRRSFAQARQLVEQHDELETRTLDLQQQAAELEEQAMTLETQAEEATRAVAAIASTNDELAATITRLEAAESLASSAKSEQEESQSLLDFALDSSPVGVALHDSELRIVRVNAAMATMTGLPASAHRGKTIDQIASDDIVDVIKPMLQRVLMTSEPVLNVPLSDTNAADPMRERHFLWSFFPVGLSGSTRGVGAVVLETTQYRQLEEQLLQSQKMEAVGRLAGGVAHDFNNMLTAVKSYSELVLADMSPDSQQGADMREIIKAADRATALTRQLLAFSRQQVLRPSIVDLNATIDGLCKMLQRVIGGNIELACVLGPDLWTVTADPTELERVIVNLALNSRDAMPDGGRLTIATSNLRIDEEYANTHADAAPGHYAMIAVTDTGSGMSREVREKLFEPFFTTKGKGEGTGLGLSTVYGIVKQFGGFVWVYSEPGRGTTFKVYLPRADQAPVRFTPTPRRNRRVGSETILLVEDNAEVRQVATRILRRNGYRVLEAVNGADALRVYESEPASVDLVVTDIVMPEMGGAELAERIREVQPDARFLFTSGYTEDAVMRQSFLTAGEAFIEKPFTPASLAQKARETLDSPGTGEEG